jgi:hypothetical protein
MNTTQEGTRDNIQEENIEEEENTRNIGNNDEEGVENRSSLAITE